MSILEIGGISVIVAFLAGLLSCASPCVLPLIPAYLGYLTGAAAETAVVSAGGSGGAAIGLAVRHQPRPPSPFLHALSFVAGFALIFILLGASVGLIGLLFSEQQFFLRDHRDTILKIAGGTLIVLGLHLSGVITVPFLEQDRRLNVNVGDRTGYFRSFLVGSTFSAGWSPCIGPTLGVVLTLGATSATVWQSVLLLAVYSAGLAVPFLALGLGFNFVQPAYQKAKRYMGVVNYASGALLIVVGILIFTNSLINLNSLFNLGSIGDISGNA